MPTLCQFIGEVVVQTAWVYFGPYTSYLKSMDHKYKPVPKVTNVLELQSELLLFQFLHPFLKEMYFLLYYWPRF